MCLSTRADRDEADFPNTRSAGRQPNMKKPTTLVICSSLTLALALAIWSPVQAQPVPPAEGKMMMEGKPMTPGKMMECCQAMKEQKEKMMADMKAQDATLTEQVAQMNRAPENAKVNLMAGIVTQMLEQRIAMTARMEKMHDGMMQHMMQHMQMGQDSMAQCPMMKGMDGMDKKSGDSPEKQK
jgi:Spy/CpxP family protein refolding chaperone